MTLPERMPAVFIGHGSPMNTLETNRFTEAWARFGRSVPAPRAILAISAHWYIETTSVTAMESPRTIHDFMGFPRELFEFQYPATGSPEVAEEVAKALAPVEVHSDTTSWGIDHGTWSVLAHMYPEANVPVVQLSLNARLSFSEHLALGRRLGPLRDNGVLVVASGNVVHNLGLVDWGNPHGGRDWAVAFDSEVIGIMAGTPARITDIATHPCFDLSVPTPDHFLPLLYLAGLADAADQSADILVSGCSLGSLSMTSFALA